jgi:hypothetical protein
MNRVIMFDEFLVFFTVFFWSIFLSLKLGNQFKNRFFSHRKWSGSKKVLKNRHTLNLAGFRLFSPFFKAFFGLKNRPFCVFNGKTGRKANTSF